MSGLRRDWTHDELCALSLRVCEVFGEDVPASVQIAALTGALLASIDADKQVNGWCPPTLLELANQCRLCLESMVDVITTPDAEARAELGKLLAEAAARRH